MVIPDNVPSNREKRRIKTQLLSKVYDNIRSGHYTKRYYVTLPLITKHQNHPVLDNDAGRLRILHPRIIEKIYEIVQQGISERRVVKYMLQEYVQEIQSELGIEIQSSDRSFYPTDRDIGNHIRNAKHLVKKEETQLIVDSEPPEIQSDPLPYDTEVVATPSFVDIPTECEVNLDLNAPGSALYQTATVSQNTNFVENIADNASSANYAEEAKALFSPQDVTTLEEIVKNGVLRYYPNTDIEVSTNDTTSGTTIIDETTVNTVVEATANVTSTSDMDVNMLIEHCKRNPNPVIVKKKTHSSRWSQKAPRSLQKHMDMKVLLKQEIENSFTVINQALANENDETKLKLILKKVKILQRIIQGREPLKRKARRSGIHTMVDIENIQQQNL